MPLTRRRFLALAGAGVAAAACSSDGGSDSGSDGVSSSAVAPVTAPAPPPLPEGVTGSVFTLGVAAGDPLPGGFVAWTRLAPGPLEPGGGMPEADVDVQWQVATDDAFVDLVRSGTVTASSEYGHAIHVDVDNLDPDETYFYRFLVGDQASPVGRARTLPAPEASPTEVRFAMATCQDLASGYYAAHRSIAAEPDLAAVLFLGDYIYEFGGPDQLGPGERNNIGPPPLTLEDYRHRYAQYKSDPDLQAAHAAAAWVVLWDDHEVENNYEAAVPGPGSPVDAAAFPARRTAAYQAWWEHQPVRVGPPSDGSLRIYRELAFGDLVRFLVLDDKQYGAPPPCRDLSNLDVGPSCPEREDPSRSLLGEEQEQWVLDALANSDSRWNAVAQGVMLGGLNSGPPEGPPTYFLESWDGYPEARRRLVEGIEASGARNPIVLTGDYHASFVLDVRPDPFDLTTPAVAPEFLVTSISTFTFPADYTAQNPHVRYFEPRNGYAICTVTPDEWRTEFRYVSDVKDPDATVSAGPSFVVRDGEHTATRL
jgi:alkaline phosphatase D